MSAVRAELACLAEFGHFLRRHRRYWVIGAALYGTGVRAWSRTRVLRVGFCLLQAVDDLLDGDRRADGDPRMIAEAVAAALEGRGRAPGRLGLLAEHLRIDLAPLGAAGERPLETAAALVRHMAIDHERALRVAVWDAAQLEAHHRTTFRLSLDLLLIGAGARLRAADVPELVAALGWCSTHRDLADDLGHGLVNVPREVLDAAFAEGQGLADLDGMLRTRAARTWLSDGLHETSAGLARLEPRLATDPDRAGARVCGIFVRSIQRFARRHAAGVAVVSGQALTSAWRR